MTNLHALTNYALQDHRDGLGDYGGEPLDLTFYRMPSMVESKGEQAVQHAETALNNALLRTESDHYAAIPIEEIRLDDLGQLQEYSTVAELRNDARQFFSTEETGEYNVVMYPGGTPSAYSPAGESWAVIFEMGQIPERTGTPLFTRERTTVLPARGAGMALGMDDHAWPASVLDDELVGDVYVAFGPMYSMTLEEYQEEIGRVKNSSEMGASPENARIVERTTYATVYIDAPVKRTIEVLDDLQ